MIEAMQLGPCCFDRREQQCPDPTSFSIAARYAAPKPTWLLLGSGVVPGGSRNQAGDEGAKQGFAASTRVVHGLEEAEIERQFVLRDAPVRAKPGAQQRPEALCGRPWRSNACLSGRSTILRRIGQPGDDGNFLAWSVSPSRNGTQRAGVMLHHPWSAVLA